MSYYLEGGLRFKITTNDMKIFHANCQLNQETLEYDYICEISDEKTILKYFNYSTNPNLSLNISIMKDHVKFVIAKEPSKIIYKESFHPLEILIDLKSNNEHSKLIMKDIGVWRSHVQWNLEINPKTNILKDYEYTFQKISEFLKNKNLLSRYAILIRFLQNNTSDTKYLIVSINVKLPIEKFEEILKLEDEYYTKYENIENDTYEFNVKFWQC